MESEFQDMAKNFAKFSEQEVAKIAKKIVSDKESLSQHLYRTQKCRHGVRCNRKETCVGAHFADEYRVNTCLHLQYCNRGECEKYHPNLGSVEGYMVAFGIKFEYASKEAWLASTSKKPYPVISKPVEDEPNAKRQRTFAQSHPNLAPLANNHKINRSVSHVDSRICTQLCNNVKEDSPCHYDGCKYAHSVDQLVLRKCSRQGCSCKAIHDGEDKIKAAERIFGQIADFMKRETRFNHAKEMATYQSKIKEQENFRNLLEEPEEKPKNADQVESICEMLSQAKIEDVKNAQEDEHEDEDDDEEDEVNVIINVPLDVPPEPTPEQRKEFLGVVNRFWELRDRERARGDFE